MFLELNYQSWFHLYVPEFLVSSRSYLDTPSLGDIYIITEPTKVVAVATAPTDPIDDGCKRSKAEVTQTASTKVGDIVH